MEKRHLGLKIIIAAAVIIAAVALIGGFIGGDLMYHLENRDKIGPLTRSDIEYLNVAAPTATSKDGTVNAADWAEIYPYIVATMGDNAKNSYVTSYLEEDPYLVNIYEGYGFAREAAPERKLPHLQDPELRKARERSRRQRV